MQRTLATEPDIVFEAVSSHGGLAVAVARYYLAGHLRRVQRKGELSGVDAQAIAEVLVRLSASFIAVPDSCIRLEGEADARAFARRFLPPILHASAADGGRRS